MDGAWADEGTRRAGCRLLLALGFAAAGLGAISLGSRYGQSEVDFRHLASSALYNTLIVSLLAIGLYASVYGISRKELQRNARRVSAAVTIGVVVKAALTGGLMVLAYHKPAYLMLGIAVAQIDPLAVAAMLRHSRMSQQAKSILLAWASFDDPITVLLVIYLTSFLLPRFNAGSGSAQTLVSRTNASSYAVQLAMSLTLCTVAAVAWCGLRTARQRWPRRAVMMGMLEYGFLLGILGAAIRFNLLIALTVCALFFRPPLVKVLPKIVSASFYAAAFLLGMLLISGVDFLAGLLLGATAFSAQLVVSYPITRGIPRQDRAHLALGQQNGITAIILALALAPRFPQAGGIIAVAILVTNSIHVIANGLWDHYTLPPEILALNPAAGQTTREPAHLPGGGGPSVGEQVPATWFGGPT